MNENSFENIPIDFDQLPKVEDAIFHPIDEKYANILYISYALYSVFILGLLVVLVSTQFGLFDTITYAILLGWFLFFLASMWFAYKSAATKEYSLRTHDVSFKEGVFFKEWTTVPFNRVQHCEIHKGFIDNFFNLAELRIYTAGGSSSDLRIPGLHPTLAFEIKEQIISKIHRHDEEE